MVGLEPTAVALTVPCPYLWDIMGMVVDDGIEPPTFSV